MNTLIEKGHVIDPASGINEVRDVLIVDGKIASPSMLSTLPKPPERIDASGLYVVPGLIDLHVHFREPGQSAKETILSGARCAAAGGFTTVVCMPNTSPVIDSPGVVGWIQERAKDACVNVLVAGALTKGIAGEELAPIGALKKAGVVALTDDGRCVQNHEVMRRACEYAGMFGLTVMDHCQDYAVVGKGVMHEGAVSHELGLPGWPALGEELIVARNALLAELTGTPIHCQHLSSKGSVRILREARSRGVPLSGEVCPHHLLLLDECVRGFDTNFKMNPPLRSREHVEGLIEGIVDGTITILASDHAPHCSFEKEVEFDQAPFGVLGLETEFAVFHTVLTAGTAEGRKVPLPRLIKLLTVNPSRLLGLNRGTLAEGAAADVALIDAGAKWTVNKEESFSLSRNNPYHGREFTGRVVRTIVSGKTVWQLGDRP